MDLSLLQYSREIRLDKVGQGIIYKCEQAEFTLVEELDETERGEGGYGHTGVRN